MEDPELTRKRQAISTLTKIHNLSHEKRENRAMTLEDLKLQLDTTLRTTEKSFKLGEQRILAILFLLLLAPAGSRPSSILQMRFGDLELVLRRDPFDPLNGPTRLLIRFRLKFTKRYLGPKACKTFHIPEIIQEPNFILNPHVFLLGILFRHRAFRAPGLNDNPQALEGMAIHDDEPELCIPLRDDILNVLIFRRADRDLHGYVMSEKPISLSMMGGWVKRIGELIGFKSNTICYSLRYMAGNALDQSGTFCPSFLVTRKPLSYLRKRERVPPQFDPRPRAKLGHISEALSEPERVRRPLGGAVGIYTAAETPSRLCESWSIEESP